MFTKYLKFVVGLSLLGGLAFTVVSCLTVGKGVINPTFIPGAEYVGMESCAVCHSDYAANFERTSHARFTITDKSAEGEAEGCETCHGPGSLHVEGGGDKTKMVKGDANLCYQCHMEKKVQFRLQYHHPVPEGRMSCATCHDPHGSESKIASLKGPNEKCFQCHPDKRGPFVFEHGAVREGCTSCHNPHGSINDKLLTEKDQNLCLKCHYEATFPTIGGHSHANYFTTRKAYCLDCHEYVHGSNFSKGLHKY